MTGQSVNQGGGRGGTGITGYWPFRRPHYAAPRAFLLAVCALQGVLLVLANAAALLEAPYAAWAALAAAALVGLAGITHAVRATDGEYLYLHANGCLVLEKRRGLQCKHYFWLADTVLVCREAPGGALWIGSPHLLVRLGRHCSKAYTASLEADLRCALRLWREHARMEPRGAARPVKPAENFSGDAGIGPA
jgi:hypothetical protein